MRAKALLRCYLKNKQISGHVYGCFECYFLSLINHSRELSGIQGRRTDPLVQICIVFIHQSSKLVSGNGQEQARC
jgi:hypothetical protein